MHEIPLGWITAADVAQGFEEYTFTNYIKVIYPLIRDQNEKVPIIVYSMFTFALSFIYNLGEFITAIADRRHEFLRERKNNNPYRGKVYIGTNYTFNLHIIFLHG